MAGVTLRMPHAATELFLPMDKKQITPQLPHEELLQLKRWNTPTIYNGWEQITQHDPAQAAINLEVTTDFMPQMGPMVGWAVTLQIEPSQSRHKESAVRRAEEYREYIAGIAGPKIVVVQDLDKPATTGSFWGEVNANIHRALGCVGTITDGAVRDIDEMTNAGFKALARRLCVGHAHVVPVNWGCDVKVFGQRVKPGQLIHADKHGFLAIPPGEEKGLLDAAVFMDQNECNTVIKAARGSTGLARDELTAELDRAIAAFGKAAKERFGDPGEFGG
jgi:regulator of RNase E activity RraA